MIFSVSIVVLTFFQVPQDQDDIIIEETMEGIPGEISEHEIVMEEEATPVILGNEQVVGQQEEIGSYEEAPAAEDLILEDSQAVSQPAAAAVVVSALPETNIGRSTSAIC